MSAAPIKPFFWSIRRELWENKFVFIAPAAIALLVLVAYLIGTVHLPQIMQANPQPHNTAPPTGLPFVIAAVSVLATSILTGAFYALSALYGERRDRSILFWKSLPISDRTVVLSKAAIPLLILPAFTYVVTLAMHLVMLSLSAAFALTHGTSEPAFWIHWPFLQMAVVLFYGFVTMAVWYAPLYGWLFLVSAWAKRAPFIWAILPPLALAVAEKVALNSSILSGIILDRICGAFNAAFVSGDGGYTGPISIDQIAPRQFLATPGLWIGLLVAVGFFWAAIQLRRSRGPI